MIKALGRIRDVDGVLSVLERFEADDPSKPDVVVYNYALAVCVDTRRRSAAERLFNHHMVPRNNLNVVSFNLLIELFVGLTPPDFAAACSVLRSIRSFGLTPDQASYNLIVAAAIPLDKVDLAWDLVDEMESLGLQVCFR